MHLLICVASEAVLQQHLQYSFEALQSSVAWQQSLQSFLALRRLAAPSDCTCHGLAQHELQKS